MIENSKEKDILNLITIFISKKRLLVRTSIIGLLLGILIAFTTPKEYTSSISLLALDNSAQNNLSGLMQQFGGLTGLNLSASKEGLSPEIYPNFVYSTPFTVELLNEKFHFAHKDTTIRLIDYFTTIKSKDLIGNLKYYTIGFIIRLNKDNLPKHIGDIDSTNSIYVLTSEYDDLLNEFQNRINVEVDEMTNIVKIQTKMPDPVVAAQLADSILNKLTTRIANYRTQKAQADFNFISKQQQEAEKRYTKAQLALAQFRDINRNIVQAAQKSEEERLTAELNLCFNLYNNLTQQKEAARINVQQSTPVFKVLNPAVVPIKKSEPKRLLIIATSPFLGLFIGILIILFQRIRDDLKLLQK
jgi:uncharacterized protein involved in exopolysaccharide biosynthesis